MEHVTVAMSEVVVGQDMVAVVRVGAGGREGRDLAGGAVVTDLCMRAAGWVSASLLLRSMV